MAAGRNPPGDLDPWDARGAAMAPLIAARAEIAEELARARSPSAAADLGLPGTRRSPTRPRAEGGVEEIRGDSPAARGRPAARPHLLGPAARRVKLALAGKALRRFGSQGQQRIALLALLSAERELLLHDGPAPLMLLDDVMSELDPARRGLLVEHLGTAGQTLITATDRDASRRRRARACSRFRSAGRPRGAEAA